MSRNRGRSLDPKELVRREMSSMTQEISMSDLGVPEVQAIETGEHPDIYKKQEELDSAIKLFKSRNTVRLEKDISDNDKKEIYHLYVRGKNPLDEESEVIFKLNRGSAESKYIIEMLVRISGGLS